MKTIYMVKHCYDEDGGFGDAVRCDDTVAVFENLADAEAFVKAFEDPHVYDKPYADLCCGELEIEEMAIMTEFRKDAYNPDAFWWLNGSYDRVHEPY